MSKLIPTFRLVFSALALVCGIAAFVLAQAGNYERSFQNQRAEVDKAIQDLHASISGRLPILDGFVAATDQPLDRYTRGFYQCGLQLSRDPSGATKVQVSAKITAWYSDPNAAKSGYQELPSNGRLEMDLLDRLEELLGKKAAGSPTPPRAAPPPTQASVPVGHSAPAAAPDTFSSSSSNKTASIRTPPPMSAVSPSTPAVEPAAATPNDADLNSMKEQRGAAERRIRELNGEIQNLQEILKSQTHPTDLASVRKSGTPVLSKPQSNSTVLFSAEAEDEFQILDKEGDWIHVQVSGASRGWIRRSQLDLPEGFADATSKESATDANGSPTFSETREETHPFDGQWQPLHGKSVRIIWVQAASASSSAEAKRSFAKSLFLKAYKEVSSADQTVAGIVIVFDAADGGQIAATLASVQKWQAGSLPDAEFWKQCSLDPPELLQESDHP